MFLSWDLRKSHDSNFGRDSRETDSEFTVVHSHNVMQGFETVDLISFHVACTVGIFSSRQSASMFLIFVRKYSLIH